MTASKHDRIKLGALLLTRGLISEKQLDEALKSQMIFGGRLGTNLVELGYLDEEALAYFLSENIGVPYAHPKTLLDIDPSVVALVPKNIAERYRVLPVGVKRKRLKLVMADPQDFEAIKEIGFMTGYVIEPMVTPELRLTQALEAHYAIPRGHRAIPFRDELKERKDAEDREERKKPSSKSHPTPIPVIKGEATADQAQSPAPEDEVSEEIILEKVQRLREKRKTMLAKGHGKVKDQAETETIATPGKEAMHKLKTAEDRDAVGGALLHYVAMSYPLGAVLAVRGEMAIGWCATGSQYCDDFTRKLRIPLNVPSILKRAGDTGFALHNGPDENPMDKMLRRLMGVESSLGMGAAAIYYQNVIVCFLLVVGPGDLFSAAAIGELKTLAKEAGASFERLIKPLHKEAT